MNWLAVAIAALIIIGVLVSGQKELFGVAEFLERPANRHQAEGSTYAQQTNHLKAPDSKEAPRGEPTGHRVGQWSGHTALF